MSETKKNLSSLIYVILNIDNGRVVSINDGMYDLLRVVIDKLGVDVVFDFDQGEVQFPGPEIPPPPFPPPPPPRKKDRYMEFLSEIKLLQKDLILLLDEINQEIRLTDDFMLSLCEDLREAGNYSLSISATNYSIAKSKKPLSINLLPIYISKARSLSDLGDVVEADINFRIASNLSRVRH